MATASNNRGRRFWWCRLHGPFDVNGTGGRKEQLQLVVAHVNHQLREASAQEAQYLATYCQQRELTYYETRWEDPEKQRNLEAKARTFRYEFLKKSWKLKVRRF